MTIPGDPPHTDPAHEETASEVGAQAEVDAQAEAVAPEAAYPPPLSGWRRWAALGATPAIIVALVAGFTLWHSGKPRQAPVADPASCRLINAKEALSGYVGGTCWAVWAAPGTHGAGSAVFQIVVGGPSYKVTASAVAGERTTPLAVCANGSGLAADGGTIKVAVYRLGPQAKTATASEGGRQTPLPLFSDGGTLFAVLSSEADDDASVTAADSSGRPVATLSSADVWNVGDTTTRIC
ncbi:MAG TPA: hypothetical protein VGX23_18065 [Actinocrinis sp.]|nr:hypothetical protein [Actinocrinis sp.]